MLCNLFPWCDGITLTCWKMAAETHTAMVAPCIFDIHLLSPCLACLLRSNILNEADCRIPLVQNSIVSPPSAYLKSIQIDIHCTFPIGRDGCSLIRKPKNPLHHFFKKNLWMAQCKGDMWKDLLVINRPVIRFRCLYLAYNNYNRWTIIILNELILYSRFSCFLDYI